MSKSCKLLLACTFVLAAMVVAPALAAAQAVYVDLTPNLEKWFRTADPAKCGDLRMRTVVGGSFNGAVLQTREILQDGLVVSRERMLLSRDTEGNVFYHGDPLDPLARPVLWVDAPLAVGQTWTDEAPAGGESVHYVFAVLDQRMVTCPAGNFDCHRVFVAIVQPDGSAEHHDFWYNPACGLIRCVVDGQGTFALQKSQVLDGPDRPDDDLDRDPRPGVLEGLSTDPNPFNPATTVRFDLGVDTAVTVEIFDLAGHRVRTLARAEHRTSGPCVYRWDGRDGSGRAMASGMYVARVQAGQTIVSRRMSLVR
jgi:hypothetical protein